MKNEKIYNIGLDIGVGSVGWCVTDENSNLLKKNGKNMWGSRIFEEAKTAADTRTSRTSRRRLSRRRERINILQSLIQEDMEKEYPNFFPMLRETSLDIEDKTIVETINSRKYNLFADENMTDANYFKQFPTIYHLRNYLINETEKVDIRLVYLALHHIIKYRGNFLYEGEFSSDTDKVSESLDTVLEFLSNNYDIEMISAKEDIYQILNQKNRSRTQKKEELLKCFDYQKQDKQVIENVLHSFLGKKFDLNKIFDVELKRDISFADEIENEDAIIDTLQEDQEIYFAMKAVYSWYILQDILNGNVQTFISQTFIDKYNKYSEDLKLLKKIYIKYFSDEYKEMFRRVGENNYVAYNGKNSGKTCKKCKEEAFFDNLKSKIDKLPDSCEEKQIIKDRIADNDFLRKLNVTDNGAIPHQLHSRELKQILENQSKYYRTLEENKDKIISLFEFRVPYYVGPLAKNNNSKWAWLIRKSDEKIRPWNFDEVVDEDATAEKFINRMTNNCTYILNEKVMPKQSILYSEFCVLNELNNVRINDKHLSRDTKNLIIDKLFKKQKKVTRANIEKLLEHEGFTNPKITGIPDGNNFTSNMSAYVDMSSPKIFGKVDESNIEQCEELIYWITIFEEKKILKRKIEQKYPEFTDEQVKNLVKLKYSGWSRLSKQLLVGLKSYDGETIIEKLRKTHLNFMQIINEEKFGFNKQLEELMPKFADRLQYKDVEEIPTSPANKRAIWQTIRIVDEITKIMKKQPKNIYVEFARNEEKNKNMKDNRAKQLLRKYEEMEKQISELKNFDYNVYKELKQHQSDKELSEKMYLYFIQEGKCLYSGTPLDINDLNKYEVDHIMPQSYIKDDSIDNKALVLKKENQRKKNNLLLLDEIIDKQITWWERLLKANLISQTKYYRLIKRKMLETDEEKEMFVRRQLVETRQITKYVTNLLKNKYKSTDIFTIRAGLTHDFRTMYKLYKNRNVNNYHHAQDAYILCTIGNILDSEWHGLENFKYGEYVKKYFKENDENKEKKHGIIMGFIYNRVDASKVKKVMNYKDCFVTRMLEEQTGEFYNQTLYSIDDKSHNPVIPLKNGKRVEKYGGYSGENKAYYVIFEFTNKKGKQYQLIGIPIKNAYDIKAGKESVEEFIKRKILKDTEYTNFRIIRNKVLKNQEYLDENNEPMIICSDSEIRSNKELVVNEKMTRLIYLMNTSENKLNDEAKEELNNSYEYMYNYLLDKLKNEYKLFSGTYKKLIKLKDEFIQLEENDKKEMLNKIIQMMSTGGAVNFKSLNSKLKLSKDDNRKLSSGEGRKNHQKFDTKQLKTITFVDKSTSGMYERILKLS